MPSDGEKRPPVDPGERCWHCGQPIREQDHVLHVSTAEGHQLALHAECFTETTFDPDVFRVEGLA
jgi:hypothetical protein